jgi:hypothetical protein
VRPLATLLNLQALLAWARPSIPTELSRQGAPLLGFASSTRRVAQGASLDPLRFGGSLLAVGNTA